MHRPMIESTRELSLELRAVSCLAVPTKKTKQKQTWLELGHSKHSFSFK